MCLGSRDAVVRGGRWPPGYRPPIGPDHEGPPHLWPASATRSAQSPRLRPEAAVVRRRKDAVRCLAHVPLSLQRASMPRKTASRFAAIDRVSEVLNRYLGCSCIRFMGKTGAVCTVSSLAWAGGTRCGNACSSGVSRVGCSTLATLGVTAGSARERIESLKTVVC